MYHLGQFRLVSHNFTIPQHSLLPSTTLQVTLPRLLVLHYRNPTLSSILYLFNTDIGNIEIGHLDDRIAKTHSYSLQLMTSYTHRSRVRELLSIVRDLTRIVF